jgi:hypothetical protein
MNCSQLLERRANTSWERPAQTLRDLTEDLGSREAESGRWNAVRFASLAQTFAPWLAPNFKPSSN